MRTTVTLDPDTHAIVRRLMRQRGVSFKQALNDAIRAGGQGREPQRAAVTRPRDMGTPLVDLTHALRLNVEPEDDERVRRMAAGR